MNTESTDVIRDRIRAHFKRLIEKITLLTVEKQTLGAAYNNTYNKEMKKASDEYKEATEDDWAELSNRKYKEIMNVGESKMVTGRD